MESGNGLERWRGRTDERLDGLDRDIDVLFKYRDSHEAWSRKAEAAMSTRITKLEARVAMFAAIGSAAAWGLFRLADLILKHV